MILFGIDLPDWLVGVGLSLFLSNENESARLVHVKDRIYSDSVTPAFNARVTQIAKNLAKNPSDEQEVNNIANYLMAHMVRESGLDQAAHLNRYVKKDSEGNTVYKKDKQGNIRYNRKGNPIPVYRYKAIHGLAEIVDEAEADTIGGGLGGFMRDTAQMLWKKKGVNYISSFQALKDLLYLSAVDQLDFIELFFLPLKGKINSITDIRIFAYWPAAIGKPMNYVLFDTNDATTYEANIAADLDKDGEVTVGEVSQKVIETYNKGIEKLQRRK